MTCCHSTHNYSNFHQSAVLPWEQLSQLPQREKEERFSVLTPSVYPLPLTLPFPSLRSITHLISLERFPIHQTHLPTPPTPPAAFRKTDTQEIHSEGGRSLHRSASLVRLTRLLCAVWSRLMSGFTSDSAAGRQKKTQNTKHKTQNKNNTHTQASC